MTGFAIQIQQFLQLEFALLQIKFYYEFFPSDCRLFNSQMKNNEEVFSKNAIEISKHVKRMNIICDNVKCEVYDL